jgi:hypothetical protein
MPTAKLLRSARRATYLAAITILAVAMNGCSGRAKVSGRVTFNGNPLPAGKITFIGANGKASDPVEIADGNYSVFNAPIGECKIKVETQYLMYSAINMPGGMGGGMGGKGMPGMKPGQQREKKAKEKEEHMPDLGDSGMKGMLAKLPEFLVAIPGDYENPEKTPLTFTVKSGTNIHDVELTGPDQKINFNTARPK